MPTKKHVLSKHPVVRRIRHLTKTDSIRSFYYKVLHKVLHVLLIIAIVGMTLPMPLHDVYANGTPSLGLSFSGSQSSQPLIGESFAFTATFQNTSPIDAGYGPYVDLIFPVNGIDGNHSSSTPDGTNFLSATYLGVSLVATQLTFPVSTSTVGCVTHPYAKDTSNQSIQYCGTTGDKLVVLQLPFGSFTPGQPPVDIIVNASLSNLADANAPLTISGRAGFQYGGDALNNPMTDPTIISSTVNTAVTPTILRIRKQYNGPEDEIATGPNDPKSYTISVDLPNGMTVTNLDLTDKLPSNMQYVSVSGQSPAGSTIQEQPSTLLPQIAPNNALTIRWPSVTGTASNTDASYVMNFFIPKLNASSTDVINPSTGASATSIDDIRAQASWTPIDGRDAPSLVVSDASPSDHSLNDTVIAAQKSSAIVTDTGPTGLTPGDTVEYTVVFQISDFFALSNLHATDTISDGQLLSGFTPTFSFSRGGSSSTGTMFLANVSSTHDTPGTGQTYLDLNLSAELADRAHADSGDVLGGCVPSGGGISDCSSYNGGLTTGTIKYRTVVQTTYTDDYPSGFPNVDQGDPISNTVLLRGSVLNTATLLPTGSTVSNGSDESLNIITGTLTQKAIYAVNGNTSFSSPVHISPGDEVTYRLQVTHPTSNLDSYRVSDYLPLPIFSATSVTSFVPTVSASVPAAGVAKFGPSDTFYGATGVAPTLLTSAVSNSVTFDFGDNLIPGGQVATITDILFTVTASNRPFTDGLFLTNQAQATEGDTQTQNNVSTQIVQLILNEPNLSIYKGAVKSDSGSAAFTPSTVGPVTFQSPSGTCPSFSGTITSTNLASSPIGSSVSGIDAMDQVKFAIVLENTGNSPNGAFDVKVKDVLPTGMSVSSTGLHLCVMRGDGVAIPYTDLGGGLFGTGISLNDTSSTQASIGSYSTTTGANIAVITYDLTLNGNALPSTAATNTATLFNYAGDEGGPDFTAIDLTDSVNITTKAPTISKTILATSATSSFGNDLVIGEQVQYQVRVTVPEATSTGVTLVDTLPTNMAIVSLDSLTASSSVNTTAVGGYAGALSSAVISNSGRTATISLGTISNTDTNNSATETIQLVMTGVMLNVAGNQAATTKVNQGTWNWTGQSISANAPTVTVREPVLTLTKTASPSTLSGGQTTTFTLTVAHASTSTQPAFDVSLTDLMPTNLSYVPATLANVSGTAATLDDSSSTRLLASWNNIATGTASVISFQATAANNVTPSSTLTNTANLQWSTLAGNQAATSSSPYVTTGCERTGNVNQTCGLAANDQSVTTTRNIAITTPTVIKTLTGTSATSTAGTNVAIGEILTYQVAVIIPEGTLSSSTTLTDSLPTNGLAILDVQSVTASGTLTTSHAGGFPGVLADVSVTSTGYGLSFPFDDITNPDLTTSTQESILVTYRAVVVNSSANVKGITRKNTAGWTWTGGSVTSTSGNVTIVEPVMTNVLAATTSTGDAADVVTYTVTVGHAATSTAIAFDLSQAVALPSDLIYQPGSLINLSGEPATLDDSSSTNLLATWSSLGTSSSSVLQFQAAVSTSSAPGQVLLATSTLLFTGLQGDVSTAQSAYNTATCERSGVTTGCGGSANTYRVTSTKMFTMGAPASVKALIQTSAGHTSGTSTAIGERATYQFSVTLPEGTSPSLVLRDLLPAGLGYVPATVTVSSTAFNGTLPAPTVSSTGGSGDDVDIIFGPIVTTPDNVSSNNRFDVQLEARVLNTAGNNTGSILDNSATVTVGNSSSTSNHVALLVVEPALQTTKLASNSIPAFGETVTYTLNVAHASSSNADAFEPVVTDVIPAEMSYVGGSAVLPPGWSVNESGNPTIVFSASSLTTLDSVVSMTYQATVANASGTTLGNVLVNYATTTWSSLPGTDPNERTGAGGLNDHFHNASKAVTITGPDIHISKTDNGVSTTPSSTVTYFLNYGNSGNGADTGVVLNETVPVGTIFNNGASTPGWSCPDASPAGTPCTLSIGVLGAGASSTVAFAVTVTNPAAQGVTLVSNTATITDDGTYTDPTTGDRTASDTTPLDAAPDFVITKTDFATSTVPGALVVYTLSYANVGDQDAAGVTIEETVPAHTTFSTASSSVGWSSCTNGSASGTTCTYSVGSLAGGGASGTVTFAVLVDYPLNTFTSSLINTATIDDDGTNGLDPTPVNNTDTDTDTIIQQGPEYVITVDDVVTSVHPGDSMTYTYTITNNGNVNGTGVAVTSTFPEHLVVDLVSNGGIASTTASGTTVVVWPGFALAGAGTNVIRTVDAHLALSVPLDVTSTHVTAEVADDGLNGTEMVLVNNSSSDTDMIIFPPEGGGGGPPPSTPPAPPTTYQTITYVDGDPVSSSTEPIPPPPAPPLMSKPVCTLGCDDVSFDLSIINPDKSERRVSSGYAQIEKLSATKSLYRFEDRGIDFDYNDVLIEVDRTNCLVPVFTVKTVNAKWHHQIRAEVYVKGELKDRRTLWMDSHAALGQKQALFANADEKLCAVSTCKLDTCDGVDYQLYIRNPDGTVREMGTSYVKKTILKDGRIRYGFEDKGDDFDYNDVVLDIDASDCGNLRVSANPSDARWHHQIHMRLLKYGVVRSDVELWTDSHLAPGQGKSVNAKTDANMCKVLPSLASQNVIVLYEHVNYGGKSQTFVTGESNPDLSKKGFADVVSSVKVFGDATAELFRDKAYKGLSEWFTVSDPDLRNNALKQDTAKSVKVKTVTSTKR